MKSGSISKRGIKIYDISKYEVKNLKLKIKTLIKPHFITAYKVVLWLKSG